MVTLVDHVLIYDPNTLNPYGTELARQLSERFSSVSLMAPKERLSSLGDTPFGKRAALAGTSSSAGTKLYRRLVGPVVALRRSRGKTLIVVWTRDAWDALVFTLAATLGRRIAFIYHNPPQVRPRAGAAGWAERLLARHTVCAFHSSWLANTAGHSVGRSIIVTHPPYTALHSKPSQSGRGGSPKPAVAIVGALRSDKGVSFLPSIARSSGGGWTLRVVGGEKLPLSIRAAVEEAGVEVDEPFARPPSDEALQKALTSCDVMLAPYRSVTESGSIILAESVGVPVLSLTAEALSASLNERSMAGSEEELGSLLRAFLRSPWPTFVRQPGTRAIETGDTWVEAIRNA